MRWSVHRLAAAAHPSDVASVMWLLAVAVIAVATFRDYGLTWDETVHMDYGDAIYDFWSSGGENTRAITHKDRRYGGGFDLLSSLVRQVVPGDPYELHHFLTALVGVIGLLGAWALGRLGGGPTAGLLALALLTLTPVYYGHMFANPKDIPFASAYVWALYGIAHFAKQWPRVGWRHMLGLGALLGLATCVRIGGLLVFCYFGLVALVLALKEREPWPGRRSRLWKLTIGSALAVGMGWLVTVLPWPWALQHPLTGPFETLGKMSRFKFDGLVAIGGEQVIAQELPVHYLLHYGSIQLPVVLLVGAIGATGLVVAALLSRKARGRLGVVGSLAFFAAVFPVVFIIVRGSVVYDTLRHVLIVIPPLCAVTAVLISGWLRNLRLSRAWIRYAALIAALAIGAAVQIDSMVRLHPYQYVDYNLLVGGFRGAYPANEGDYYGQSAKNTLHMLAQELWEEDPVEFLYANYSIKSCLSAYFVEGQALPSFLFLTKRERPNFFLAYRRQRCERSWWRNQVMVETRREGHSLTWVRDLRRRRQETSNE